MSDTPAPRRLSVPTAVIACTARLRAAGRGAIGLVAIGLSATVLGAATAGAQDLPETPLPGWLPNATAQICSVIRRGDSHALSAMAAPIDMRITAMSIEASTDDLFRAAFEAGPTVRLVVTAFAPGSDTQRTAIAGYRNDDARRGEPIFVISAGPDCQISNARAIASGEQGENRSIVRFSGPSVTLDGVEPLNPMVPDGADPGGVRVAYVGSGVAYDQPEISSRLARGPDGAALGYDFKDGDLRPYDRDPSQPTLMARQNGTGAATLLLNESETAALIPFRFAAGTAEPAELVEMAASRGARVVLMAQNLGADFDWPAFAAATAAYPDMLFLVSAGDDGVNLDAVEGLRGEANLDRPNVLVVTSVEPDGHLSRLGNWGVETVDIAVPAERLPVRLANGRDGLSTGAAYAVARLGARTVRMLTDEPELAAADIKAALLAAAEPLPKTTDRLTRNGWIADPAG